jgi:hypothetical protein
MRYRDLDTGEYITKDPKGNELMMPKEHWMLDGKEVDYQEYKRSFRTEYPNPLPNETSKKTSEKQETEIAWQENGQPRPGSLSHYHGIDPGEPNVYTYVNQNPYTKFDPLGLENINLFPPGSPEAKSSDSFSDSRGYSVGAHGDKGQIAGADGKKLSDAGLSKLANQIKNDPKYDSTKPVCLNACQAGAKTSDGSPNAAQKLANLLNNNVIAPTGDINVSDVTTKLGPITLSHDVTLDDGGTSKTFTPQPPPKVTPPIPPPPPPKTDQSTSN